MHSAHKLILDSARHAQNCSEENSAITAERDGLLRELQRLEAIAEAESAQARKYKNENDLAHARIQELNALRVHAQDEARQCAIKLDDMERQLAYVNRKHEETEALLQTRTADLRDAQEFLSMTDDVPDTKIVDIVRRLNSNIFQTASAITDHDDFSYRNMRLSNDSDSLEQWLGTALLVLIRSVQPEFLSITIQTALQAGISQYVACLAGSWDLGGLGESGQVFQEVYEDIKNHGTPAIRFRYCAALTCACGVRALRYRCEVAGAHAYTHTLLGSTPTPRLHLRCCGYHRGHPCCLRG